MSATDKTPAPRRPRYENVATLELHNYVALLRNIAAALSMPRAEGVAHLERLADRLEQSR